jgi:hypothetical protein
MGAIQIVVFVNALRAILRREIQSFSIDMNALRAISRRKNMSIEIETVPAAPVVRIGHPSATIIYTPFFNDVLSVLCCSQLG